MFLFAVRNSLTKLRLVLVAVSQFIVGFRKEQLNANLLNGKGEIRDVELNCAALNESLSKMTPMVELERVHLIDFH